MAQAAVKTKTPKLFDRIGSYWDARTANGAEGLVLLDECIRRVASKERDWDALARFVARANMSNNAAKVKKIIRAAFGNDLTFKLDKNHPAGGRFTLGWQGAYALAGKNSYSMVKKAIEHGKSWDDKAFLKDLNDVIPDLPKAEKTVDAAAQTKAAKAMAKKLAELRDAGFNIGDLVREAQAELAKNPVANGDGSTTKQVVNGVQVITPNF